MSLIQWIIIGVFSMLAIAIGTKTILDLIWHKRMNKFQSSHDVEVSALPMQMIFKNGYVGMLSVFVVAAVFMTAPLSNDILSIDKTYQSALRVSTKDQLSELLTDDYYGGGWWNGALEDAVDAPSADMDSEERSYTDTNVQVQGVDEADVIKTDGFQIYYAPAYTNTLHVFDIANNGDITLNETIDLDNFYVSGIYLTDTQVILIGYQYDNNPYYYDGFEYGWAYVEDTATVKIINRSDLTLAFELKTDGHFYQYRLIEDMLYLFSQKYLYREQEEYRPEFEVYNEGLESTGYLSYNNIYYFDDYHTNSMSVITSINLSDYTYQSQAFMASFGLIYANTDSFYATTYYGYYDDAEGYQYRSRILKFRFNEENILTYVATGEVDGFIQDQYWMDEYNNYFRVVTTDWTNTNRLYIFEEDPEVDRLNLVSLTDEGIGLENETVKSVRFNGDLAQIVTFEQKDPLYTIDLSNPSSPIIEANPIVENGYSTYLHVWGNDDYLVGFGYDADDQGFITNLKLSAYDTNLSTPLDTYYFENDQANRIWGWSEALYNPRALLINVDKGLFAFPVQQYGYTDNDYNWTYEAMYFIFEIDFTNQSVLGDPIIITHGQTEYYNSIDRGVEIENKIYTFSREQVRVYDLETDDYTQSLNY